MRKAIVLSRGQKFGLLTVTAKAENIGRATAWKCKCSCGVVKVLRGHHLTSGRIESCGCNSTRLKRERATTHGMSRNKTNKGTQNYVLWQNIKTRTTDVNNKDYCGRGIRMYRPWFNSFETFNSYLNLVLGPRTDSKQQIDRIDNSRNYAPGNIRWATSKLNNSNRRGNRKITHQGKTKLLTDWSAVMKISVPTLYARLNVLGWSVNKALTTPVRAISK